MKSSLTAKTTGSAFQSASIRDEWGNRKRRGRIQFRARTWAETIFFSADKAIASERTRARYHRVIVLTTRATFCVFSTRDTTSEDRPHRPLVRMKSRGNPLPITRLVVGQSRLAFYVAHRCAREGSTHRRLIEYLHRTASYRMSRSRYAKGRCPRCLSGDHDDRLVVVPAGR